MLQQDFLSNLLGAAKTQGIHTAIDTAAHVPWEWYESLWDLTDLFLVDYKVNDAEIHRRMTDVSNERIKQNIRRFAECDKAVWIRVPVVPGVNANESEIEDMARFLASVSFSGQVELLKFHRLGDPKYRMLQWDNAFADIQPPTDDMMTVYRQMMQQYGLNVKV